MAKRVDSELSYDHYDWQREMKVTMELWDETLASILAKDTKLRAIG